ncbi:MAG: glutaredoxin [Gammaproteobacteria bacterium]|nr:glutaredoxin [Gammaproteobacteria bacterium]
MQPSKETKTNSDSLILYHRDMCMFCWRVQHTIKKLGIEVESRNIWQDAEYERELVEARGRNTVPVLRIIDNEGNSTWLPESSDIIHYLKKNYAA